MRPFFFAVQQTQPAARAPSLHTTGGLAAGRAAYAALFLCLGGVRDPGGDRLERKMLEREPEPVEELAVQQAALRVELLVRAGDGELVPDDAGAGDAEHLPEVGLRPHGAELARAGADDGHGLVAQSALAHRARGPVDRILQDAGNRAVVLGC